MQYRKLGQSRLEASVIGVGTWQSSGWMWGGSDRKEAIRAIQVSIDMGINLIDTAAVYGFGESEKIVADAIRGRRDKVLIATKCGLVWDAAPQDGEFFAAYDEQGQREDGYIRVYKYLAPASIRKEVEGSLKRLGVETIDLYQTHKQEKSTPIEDVMGELLKLKEEGKIRAIGVSNVSLPELQEYCRAGVVDSDQEKYSMLDREKEADLLPFCRDQQIAFLGFSPLANGVLTGKLEPDRVYEEGDHRRGSPRFAPPAVREVNCMLAEMLPIAEEHGVSVAQLVIAWSFHQPGVTHVLAGVRREQQALENAGAGDVRLNAEELARMAEIIALFEGKIPKK